MESHAFALVFFVAISGLISCVSQSVNVEISVRNLEQFTKLICNQTSVCLKSKPNKTSCAFSEKECVLECKRHNTKPEYCVGANYQARENLCEMFYSDANITYDSNFTLGKISGCQYLHRGPLVNLSCEAIFRERERPGIRPAVASLSGANPVLSIAQLNDQFFVTREDDRTVSVYNATSFQLLRNITNINFGLALIGLAVNALNNYLYISDWQKSKVHCVNLSETNANTAVTSFSLSFQPHYLSVNKVGNVIVPYSYSNMKSIYEYTPNGSIVNFIGLTESVDFIYQVIDEGNGVYFISSYGGISMVSTRGPDIKHFGGATASSGLTTDIGSAKSMAIDAQGYILVTDEFNHRVVVVNSSLTVGRELPLPANTALKMPKAICFDSSRSRLYIGEGGVQNRVLVFDNVTNLYALFET